MFIGAAENAPIRDGRCAAGFKNAAGIFRSDGQGLILPMLGPDIIRVRQGSMEAAHGR